MPRINVTPKHTYCDGYRDSEAYHKLQQTLRRLFSGEKLTLANGLTISRMDGDVFFNVHNREGAIIGRGDIDACIAYVTSSDEIDNVPDKVRRRFAPRDIREDDVELARLLSEK